MIHSRSMILLIIFRLSTKIVDPNNSTNKKDLYIDLIYIKFQTLKLKNTKPIFSVLERR